MSKEDLLVVGERREREVFAQLRNMKMRLRDWDRFWLMFSIEHARGVAGIVLDVWIHHQDKMLDSPRATMTDALDSFTRCEYAIMPARAGDIGTAVHSWSHAPSRRVRIPSLMDWLLKLALADYKLRWPKARGDRLWVYRGPVRGGGDIFCRFCGDLLIGGARVGTDYGTARLRPRGTEHNVGQPLVSAHVTTCALQSLAEIREPLRPQRTKQGEFRGREVVDS